MGAYENWKLLTNQPDAALDDFFAALHGKDGVNGEDGVNGRSACQLALLGEDLTAGTADADNDGRSQFFHVLAARVTGVTRATPARRVTVRDEGRSGQPGCEGRHW